MCWFFLFLLLFVVIVQVVGLGKVVIVSVYLLVIDVGFQIFEQGGNVYDVVVVVVVVLFVVEFYFVGMGGGGFWLLYCEKDDLQIMFDVCEMVLVVVIEDMYQDLDGQVVCDCVINGFLVVGIFGQVVVFVYFVEYYGELFLIIMLVLVIELVCQGFEVEDYYWMLVGYCKDVFNCYFIVVLVFLDEGEILVNGILIWQLDLVRVLEVLVEQGWDGFYQGLVVEKLVCGVCEVGGIWIKQDLNNYWVKEWVLVVGYY